MKTILYHPFECARGMIIKAEPGPADLGNNDLEIVR